MLIQSTLTKSALLSWRSGLYDGTSQSQWRKTCIGLVGSMDGTQCEEVHLLYMERMVAFFIHVLDYHLILVCLNFCFLLLFSRVVVLFSTRVFLIRNPHLILREGEGLWASFPHSRIFSKLPPSTTTQFLFRSGLCCRVQQRRISLSHFCACFLVESLSVHWRISTEVSRA